jgi:hypothetical protein
MVREKLTTKIPALIAGLLKNKRGGVFFANHLFLSKIKRQQKNNKSARGGSLKFFVAFLLPAILQIKYFIFKLLLLNIYIYYIYIHSNNPQMRKSILNSQRGLYATL